MEIFKLSPDEYQSLLNEWKPDYNFFSLLLTPGAFRMIRNHLTSWPVMKMTNRSSASSLPISPPLKSSVWLLREENGWLFRNLTI